MSNRKGRAFEKCISSISNVMMHISAILLLALLILGFCDVVGRYFLNRPIIGAMEVGQLLLAGMVFFGWPYAQLKKVHIRAEVIVSRLLPRTQMVADFISTLLSMALFLLIFWQGLVTAKAYHEAERLIFIIELPLAPFQLLAPFGAILLCPVFIVQMIQLFPGLKGRP